MQKISIFIISLLCLCSCREVKNESVKVNRSESLSYGFVIQIDKKGNYHVYIPDEFARVSSSKIVKASIVTQDSVWDVQLADITACLKAYEKVTETDDVYVMVIADSKAEYQTVKELMGYLQDTGYTHYYLKTKQGGSVD